MILIPLGTNGFYPSFGRQTMSFLLIDGRRALLLDAGSGVGRLGEPSIADHLAGISKLDVVLTHYHLDHVIGLAFLPGVWRGRQARIWAPAPPLIEGDPAAALGPLLAPPLFPQRPCDWPLEVEIRPYGSAGDLEPLGWDLAVRSQTHPGGSVGLRVGNRLAYVTDTIADPATVDFVAKVGLLLHEVWWSDAELASTPHAAGHSSVAAVADIARRAGIGALAAVHHRPDRDADAVTTLLADLRLQSAPVGCVELIEGHTIRL